MFFGALVVLFGIVGSTKAHANSGTFIVKDITAPDQDIDDGKCTLRKAIIAQQGYFYYHGCQMEIGSAGTNLIIVGPGTFTLASSLPPIVSGTEIRGAGYDQTTINANGVANGSQFGALTQGDQISGGISIDNLTLTNFHHVAYAGPGDGFNFNYVKILNAANPGAPGNSNVVENHGTMTFSNVHWKSIYEAFSHQFLNYGTMIFTHSTLEGIPGARCAEHGCIQNLGGYLAFDTCTMANLSVGFDGLINTTNNGTTDISFSTIGFVDIGASPGAVINSGGTVNIGRSIIRLLSINKNSCSGNVTSQGFNVFSSTLPCPMIATDITVADPGFATGTSNSAVFHGGVGPVYLPLPTVFGSANPILNRVTDNSCQDEDQRWAPRFFGACTPGAVQQVLATLVVANPNALTAGDNVIKTQVTTTFGAPWITVQADTWTGPLPTNGNRTAPVIIAGSVSDSHIGTHFRSSPANIILLKHSLFDEMNMTNSSSSSDEGTTSTTKLSHLLSDNLIVALSGFSSSPVVYDGNGVPVYSDPALTTSSVGFAWGKANVPTLWNIPGTTNHAGIFNYAAGNLMFHSFTAPAGRWGGFANDAAAAKLNPAGQRLLQQVFLEASF